jgi:hypothetical protein
MHSAVKMAAWVAAFTSDCTDLRFSSSHPTTCSSASARGTKVPIRSFLSYLNESGGANLLACTRVSELGFERLSKWSGLMTEGLAAVDNVLSRPSVPPSLSWCVDKKDTQTTSLQ